LKISNIIKYLFELIFMLLTKSNSILASLFLFLIVVSLVSFQDADALKGKGVEISKYGIATKDIVCGDILCSQAGKAQTMRHVSQTLAFQTIDGQTKLVGISGTAEENPTIIVRTGFLLSLTVENRDNIPHILKIDNLSTQTLDLAPGQTDNLMIFSNEIGEYDLLDLATTSKVGKIKIVSLQQGISDKLPISLPRAEQITPDFIFSKIPQAQPGRLQVTLAFEEKNGETNIVGIQGVSGKNPTLVTRTGFVYDLVIMNNADLPHSLFLNGFNLSSGSIAPGTTKIMTIYPTTVGVFDYYDETMLSPLGKLQVVKVEPSVPQVPSIPDISLGQIQPKISASGEILNPGRIQSTLQIENINGSPAVVGVEGVSGLNPTIVTRTGFVYHVNVINNDSTSHTLYIDGLNQRTGPLLPGQTGIIALYPSESEEGEFSYYLDSPENTLGSFYVLKVEPKIPSLQIPAQRVSAPGTIQATIAFESSNGELHVIGVKGTLEENPTLITRTGYLYTLTIENRDSMPHSFDVQGLNLDSGILQPGESSVLLILPSEEGQFQYMDGLTQKVFGSIKIVKVEPSLP
jgi:hypothetical protein